MKIQFCYIMRNEIRFYYIMCNENYIFVVGSCPIPTTTQTPSLIIISNPLTTTQIQKQQYMQQNGSTMGWVGVFADQRRVGWGSHKSTIGQGGLHRSRRMWHGLMKGARQLMRHRLTILDLRRRNGVQEFGEWTKKKFQRLIV